MLGVQLPTCVSSPDRSTSVQLEFSPTVPLSVLFCFRAGQTSLKLRTVLSTEALCLFPVHVAVSIFLLLACLVILLSAPSSSVGFGAEFWICCVYDDMLERSFVSLRDGDRPDPHSFGRFSASLTVVGLRSDFSTVHVRGVEIWYPYEGIFAGHRSVLLLLRPTFLLRTVLLWAPLLGRVCARSGRCPGFRCLLLFRPALLLALLPRLQRSVHCARDLDHPCRTKRPLVLLRPRRDGGSTVVTGAPPGSLSAR